MRAKSKSKKRNDSQSKIISILIFFGALAIAYNNCGPQLYNNTNQSTACNTTGYNGPTLIVNGQMVTPQSSGTQTIHSPVNQSIQFSLYENAAAVPCGATANGLSYWVLPTGQQVTNTCISQAITTNGQYVYTYHDVEYIDGTQCPATTTNVSVQISVP